MLIKKSGKIIVLLDQLIFSGLVLIIVLTPLYFNLGTFAVFQIGRLTLFQIIIAIIILFWIIKILLQQRITLFIPVKYLLVSLLPLFIFGIGTIISLSPQLSFWGSYRRRMGWLTMLYLWLFFFLLIQTIRSKSRIKTCLSAILISVTVIIGYALVQSVGLDPFQWKENIWQLQRVFSTLGQPNFLASYLLLVTPLILVAILFSKRFLIKFCLSLLFFFSILTIYLTLSRGAWLGLLGGIAVCFGLIYFMRLWRKKTVKIILTLILFLAVIACLINYYQPNSILKERLLSFFQSNNSGIIIRLKLWTSASKIIAQRPYLGYGLETEQFLFIKYYQPDWAIYESINLLPDRAHNRILDLLIVGGLFSLFAWLLFWGGTILAGIRYLFRQNKQTTGYWHWRSILVFALIIGLISIFISHCFSFSVLTTELYIYLFLALILVLIYPHYQRNISFNFSRPFVICLIVSGLLLTCFTVYFFSWRWFLADVYYYQARLSARKNNWTRMVDKYQQTLKLVSEEPYYHQHLAADLINRFQSIAHLPEAKEFFALAEDNLQKLPVPAQNISALVQQMKLYSLSNTYLKTTDFSLAEQFYHQLLTLSPLRSRSYLEGGQLYLSANDCQQAINCFYQALTIAPPLNHPQTNLQHETLIRQERGEIYQGLARAYTQCHRFDDALLVWQQVVRYQPKNILVHKEIANLYLQKGEIAEALKENLRGLYLNPTDSVWWYGAALLERQQGHLIKAKEYARQATQLDPDNEQIKQFLNNIK